MSTRGGPTATGKIDQCGIIHHMAAKKKPKTKPKKIHNTSPKPMGRPAGITYGNAIIDKILDGIIVGIPLATICSEQGMPSAITVNEWRTKYPEFDNAFARAREAGYDKIAADCLRISDTPLEGIETKVSPDGTTVTSKDMLGHRKLQIDTRLKLLSKWDPKRYGDKLDVTGLGEGNVKIIIGGDA